MIAATPTAMSHPKNAEPIFTPPNRSRWRSTTSSMVNGPESTTSSHASGRGSMVVTGLVMGPVSRFRNGVAGSSFGRAWYRFGSIESRG